MGLKIRLAHRHSGTEVRDFEVEAQRESMSPQITLSPIELSKTEIILSGVGVYLVFLACFFVEALYALCYILPVYMYALSVLLQLVHGDARRHLKARQNGQFA
ncbi:hypothetical protein VMCG_04925 [Cytospora schulzeri]|uniref:Uncharacterized protein n=1 Tax=Cytospora schulzeri TaxID=448051 RepID=A0A423WN57_9PEZI|nr:hypothetical protein VMCG_04925 [Valsa malicola]